MMIGKKSKINIKLKKSFLPHRTPEIFTLPKRSQNKSQHKISNVTNSQKKYEAFKEGRS